MSRRPSGRHAALVARVELRRSWRTLTDTKRGLLMLTAGGIVLPLYGLGLGAGAFFLGGALVDGSFSLARPVIGAALAGLTGLVFAVTVQRAIKHTGEPDAPDGLLTTAPYRDVLAGLLLAEFGRVGAVALLPTVGIVVGFGLGTGSALAGAVLFALLFTLATAGLLAGYALGLVAKYVAGRSEFVSRHRAGIGLVLSVGVPVAYISLNAVPAVQHAAFRAAAATPFAWYADVTFLAVPGIAARPPFAAGAVASLLVGVPVLAVAVDALAERVWYLDRVQPDHAFDPRATTLSDRLLAGRVPRQTRVVAQKCWRRARRSPFTVQFAIFPFFLLVLQVQVALIERTVPASLPVLAALASGIAGGAAFSLNPLGGEGDVLPATLTSTVSGTQFVAGLALAGGLPAAILAVALAVPLGVAAGLGVSAIAAAAGAGIVVAVGAPAVAAGVGVVFPRFETTTVRSHAVVVPSTWAFVGYAVLLGVAVVPVLVTQHPVLASLVGPRVPYGDGVLAALGLVGTTVLLALIGGVSGGYAARTVGTYRLD